MGQELLETLKILFLSQIVMLIYTTDTEKRYIRPLVMVFHRLANMESLICRQELIIIS